jgi:hypothetical protein
MNSTLRAPRFEPFALLVLAGGLFLRVFHLFQFDFWHEPYRLGGLFVAFAEAILQNGFAMPAHIPYYSLGGLPFAYPPLGFYVEALLLALFPGRQIAIANLLPPVLAALGLLAGYFLLRKAWPQDRLRALVALFAFAFLPNAFTQQVEAGGLAEAAGTLALIGFFAAAGRYRQRPALDTAAVTGVALALCVLTSPGAAIGAAALAVLLGAETLLKARFSRAALFATGLAAATGLALSAPYWLTVMLRYGRGFFILPVLGQYQSGGKTPFFAEILQNLVDFRVVSMDGAFIWNLAIGLGLLWLVFKGCPALPLAFLTLFSIPREGVWLVSIPAALLFAYGVADVLVPLAQSAWENAGRVQKAFGGFVLALVLVGLVVQPFFLVNALVADQQWKLSPAQVAGLEQARVVIPPEARVLILGNDAAIEWGPYLLQREVLNTKYGLEWQPEKLARVNRLNSVLGDAQNWESVWDAVSEMDDFRAVYVVSTQKKTFSALNSSGNSIPFTMKLETADAQVGLLGTP